MNEMVEQLEKEIHASVIEKLLSLCGITEEEWEKLKELQKGAV